jgi:uncharacterized protein
MQKTFLTPLCTFILLAALALPSWSAPPSGESLDKLFAVTKSDKMLDEMMNNLTPLIRNAAIQASGSNGVNKEFLQGVDDTIAKMIPIMKEEMSWQKLRPMMVQIYGETLTQEDVDGLIVFYQSPTGAVMVEKMPIVMKRSIELTQQLLGPMLQRLQNAVAETAAKSSKR